MRHRLRTIMVTAAATVMLGGLFTPAASASSEDPVWRNIHPKDQGNRCLDGGPSGSLSPGLGWVRVNACSAGKKSQQWRIVRTKAPGNPLQIRNFETGLCLDSNGEEMYLHNCSPTGTNRYQLWDDSYTGANLRSPGSLAQCPRNSQTGTTMQAPKYNGHPVYAVTCVYDSGLDVKDKKTWFSSTVS